MSLLITRRPEKVSGSKISRWTALYNPYLFELTRKDFTVFNTALRPAYNTTKPTVFTSATPTELTALLNVGDIIYVSSGMYNGPYTVLSFSGSYITLDTPYIGVGGTGWLNLPILINYKAFINIYDGITDELIDTLYFKPDSTGLVLADLSGAIKSIVETQDTMTFVNRNEANKSMSGSFYIGYGASFDFSGTHTTNIEIVDSYHYYWNAAALQVTGQTNLGIGGAGQNMVDYVPFNQSGSAAKFLTMFEKPVKFSGYPFSLSFIYSEDFLTEALARHQINYNINRAATSAESTLSLLTQGVEHVNALQIADEDATTTQMDVWLEPDGSIGGGGYVDDGYMDDGYVGG